MFTLSTELDPPRDDVVLTIDSFEKPTSDHPPLVRVCLRYTGETPLYFETEPYPPFNKSSAWDSDHDERLVVWSTEMNDRQQMIPEEPVGDSWPAKGRIWRSEFGRVQLMWAGDEMCQESAILTSTPREAGYPAGEYTLEDEVWISPDQNGPWETLVVKLNIRVE